MPSDVSCVGIAWHPGALLIERLLWSNTIRYPVRPSVWWGTLELLARILRIPSHLREVTGVPRHFQVRYVRHHLAHAASAYYPSPFDDAAYLTVDGRGESESMTWGEGRDGRLRQLGSARFPNSLGKLYSAVCRFLGFDRAEKDGTVMALAAYGEPRFRAQFEVLCRLNPERGLGRFELDMRYFDFQDVALPSHEMERLFGVPMRHPSEAISQTHRDIAATLQAVTEQALMCALRELHSITRLPNVVLAGGVALNSVANGQILEQTSFQQVFIQPAANDAGVSLGAALLLAHKGGMGTEKRTRAMTSAALGPEYSDEEITSTLQNVHTAGRPVETPTDLAESVARRLVAGEVVGLFRGRMEFGPRALGYRSILADPRDSRIKERLNRIKGRESFRPFAAAILDEHVSEWLCRGTTSLFMLLVDRFRPDHSARVPGVQHVDGTVRIQTVNGDIDPLFHSIIQAFYRHTGVPLVLNTSLNVRGEPIACSPADAVRVFESSSIDALVVGHCVVSRDPEALDQTGTAVVGGLSQDLLSSDVGAAASSPFV